jgi:DDE superfamily endonuclease/Helix-turn-helix of DDE superfamily endonuclease
VVTYRAILDVPRELVLFVSALLREERRARGTRRGTRALTCYRQALFALAWFRDRPGVGRLGTGFGISRATAYRYLDEVIAVLAARAPDLQQALDGAVASGLAYLILDGKIVRADACREKTVSKKGKLIDAWYSGKTRWFGGNIQALFAPGGFPLWVSEVRPGGTNDIIAAREQVFPVLRPHRPALPVLADLGYENAGQPILTPTKKPPCGTELDIGARARDTLLRALRCQGERGFALLTCRWRTLQHITASPSRIGDIAKAALVLTHFEYRKIT